MIKFTQSATMSYRLTLGEKSIVNDPSYVIRLKYDEDGKDDVWFFTPDVSEWPRRYNQLNVVTSTFSGPTFSVGGIDIIIPDFANGQTQSVTLNLEQGWGDYMGYEVYDTPPLFSGQVLELGRFYVEYPPTDFQN